MPPQYAEKQLNSKSTLSNPESLDRQIRSNSSKPQSTSQAVDQSWPYLLRSIAEITKAAVFVKDNPNRLIGPVIIPLPDFRIRHEKALFPDFQEMSFRRLALVIPRRNA